MATGMRGPKPAMPSPNVPYQVATIWGNVRKCYGCKQHFLPATPPDDHYILVRPEADWYWEKQNMQWRLGRKLNRYYHMSPHCIRRNFPRFSFAHVVVPAELPKPKRIYCNTGSLNPAELWPVLVEVTFTNVQVLNKINLNILRASNYDHVSRES